ncbi:NAD(P)H-dependent oxidoreductase [Aurantibacter crassamenti]|uniref:NADPH-dependent FMN reductase n=1 Tax=Aurantibacter crassamenti TaxID=1837375 RepID=UPI001939EB8B|nr:NAD(P)H-dependent oxidoreductase [Aurantibacter crassamenti]MBM1107295.1 NAD(P)H-dependent oxidoreductase [Aurantibacter crassamenti]
MATILAFAGSNSSTSVNYKLVQYTVSLLENQNVQLLNLTNYPFPMFSEDVEKEKGFSNSLVEFKGYIGQSDGLIISVNEHNGNVSAYFKNLTDWLSRLDIKFLEGKKVLLMSTSPGKRGAIGALTVTEQILPRFGAEVVATFSLPSFYDNLDADNGIVDADLATAHAQALNQFIESI